MAKKIKKTLRRKTDPGVIHVYVCPDVLEVAVGLTPKRAAQVAQRMLKIAERRWPRATVKIVSCEEGKEFIDRFVGVNGYISADYVKMSDIDMSLWNEVGPIFKTSITNRILIEALDINFDTTEEQQVENHKAYDKIRRRKGLV
jgi:hypothetical protein